MVSDMIESLRSTQIAFLIRNAFWVSWGGGARARNKKIPARANLMKQACEQAPNREPVQPVLLRTSFLQFWYL